MLEHMRIREPTEQDLSDLISLEKECFVDYYRRHRFTTSQFKAYLLDNRAIFLVVIHGPALIGYIVGRVNLGRPRQSARIESIAVSRSGRTRGIGGILIRRFIREARRRGCENVTLEVAVANEEAVRLFTRHKFKPWRRFPAYYSPRHDGIQMNYTMLTDRSPKRSPTRVSRGAQ